MVKLEKIKELSQRIGREFKAEKVILFGSYAYGKPAPDSDVDLLVVTRFRGKGVWKSIEILNRLDPDFSVDLLVRTPGELRKRIKWNDFFLKEIMARGKVLYEAHNPRMDQKSGE